MKLYRLQKHKKKYSSCWKTIVKKSTKKYSLFLTPRIHPHAFIYGARFISNFFSSQNLFTLILDLRMLPFEASSWLEFLILVENSAFAWTVVVCEGTRAILVDLFLLILGRIFYSTASISPCCGFRIIPSSCLECCWLSMKS